MMKNTTETLQNPESLEFSARQKIETFFDEELGEVSDGPVTNIELKRNGRVNKVQGRYKLKDVDLPEMPLTDDLRLHGFDQLRLQRMEIPGDGEGVTESFAIYLVNTDPKTHYRRNMPLPEQKQLAVLTFVTEGPEHKPVRFNLGEQDLGQIVAPDYGFDALGTETKDLDTVLRNVKEILAG